MNSYLIKSFTGLSDYEDKGRVGAFKYGRNLDVRKDVDSLTCQQALKDDILDSYFTGICRFIVPASDGNTYFFLNNGRIIKRTSAGVYSLVYTDTNVASDGAMITGAAEWYNNAGDTFLYWSSKTRLNRKCILNTSGAVNTDWSDVNATVNGQTYPKTNLTSSDYHTMRQCNGSLIGVNKDNMFLVGYDDSYSNAALSLIPGNVSKTLIERGVYTLIGCKRLDSRDQSALFVWDGVSLNWIDKKFIPSKEINALIDVEEPLMQVGSNGQVYRSDLTNIVPKFSFPGGGQVNPEGVDQDGGLALFGVYGSDAGGYSGIYTYGRRKQNAPATLNLEYQFDCDEIGAVKKVGSDILFTYKDGSHYGVKIVDTANKAVGVYNSLDLKSLPGVLDEGATWVKVVLTTAPLPAGCSISCKRKLNKTGDFIAANLEDGNETYNTEGSQEATFMLGDIGKSFETEITLTPYANTTPEIYKIEIFFE